MVSAQQELLFWPYITALANCRSPKSCTDTCEEPLIYYYDDRDTVKRVLDDWCEMASRIEHTSVRSFVKRLRFFEYGILNHADYPIGTSKLEGINNKIKLIKRKAYGFHDDEYFALKVKQAFAT